MQSSKKFTAKSLKKSLATKLMNINIPDIVIGTCLAIVAGIVPILIRAHVSTVPPELVAYFGETYLDMLAYWRGWFLVAMALVIVVYTLTDWVTKGQMPDFKAYLKNPVVIMSLAFLALTLISTALSDYTHSSLWGTRERREGAIVWLAYFIVFFTAMFYVRDLKHTKYILAGVTFSSIVMGAIGVSQLFNMDFIETDLANTLVTYRTGINMDNIHSIFHIANGTLYNPNTFGKYSSMIAPALLITAFTYKGNPLARLLIFAGGALMLVGVFASGSLGGFVGIITAVAVIVVTFVCGLTYRIVKKVRLLPNRLTGVVMVAVAIVLVGASARIVTTNETVNTHVHAILGQMERMVEDEQVTPIDYRFHGDTMHVYRQDDLIASLTVSDVQEENNVAFRDGAGNPVHPTERTATTNEQGVETVRYGFYIPGYGWVVIERTEHVLTYSTRHLAPMILAFLWNQIIGVTMGGYVIDMSEEIPAWGFYGLEHWGSQRGYIWSRTFPMLPRTVFIGYGPDTFTLAFPNHDIIGKLRFVRDPYLVFDKAHNFFLQTWVTTGGLSALLLYGLFAFYIFTTFWGLVVYKGENLFSYGLRLSLLAGISAFAVSALSTDSTIGSTTTFFVLLGMGFGLNYLQQHRKEPDEKAQNATQ